MRKEEKLSYKNYFILAAVLIVSIILLIYFYMWYSAYDRGKLANPIMNESLQMINYNEIDNYLVENENTVIYFSLLGDKQIRSFEKKFTNIIKQYGLDNKILYLNLSDDVNDKVFKELQDKYGVDSLPYIVIFKNGIVDSTFNIKDNNYDVNELITYFRDEEVIDD